MKKLALILLCLGFSFTIMCKTKFSSEDYSFKSWLNGAEKKYDNFGG